MRLRSGLCCAFGAWILLSCGSEEGPPDVAVEPAAVAREEFAEPGRADVRLSPDGSYLAYRAAPGAALGEAPALWLAPVADPAAARRVEPGAANQDDAAWSVADFRWAYSGDRLLYVGRNGEVGVPRLFAVTAADGKSRPLSPADRAARLVHLSPSHPTLAVVELADETGGESTGEPAPEPAAEPEAESELENEAENEAENEVESEVENEVENEGQDEAENEAEGEAQRGGLYLVDLESGDLELMEAAGRFTGWALDDDLDLRLAFERGADGTRTSQRAETGEWVDFSWVSAEEAAATRFLGFDGNAGVAYFLDGRGRDHVALVGSYVISGRAEVLFQDAAADVTEVLFHPVRRTPQAAAAGSHGQRWLVLDEDVRADLARLEELDDGDLEFVDRSLDDRLWLVAVVPWDAPRRFYLYDREAGVAELLFGGRPELVAASDHAALEPHP